MVGVGKAWGAGCTLWNPANPFPCAGGSTGLRVAPASSIPVAVSRFDSALATGPSGTDVASWSWGGLRLVAGEAGRGPLRRPASLAEACADDGSNCHVTGGGTARDSSRIKPPRADVASEAWSGGFARPVPPPSLPPGRLGFLIGLAPPRTIEGPATGVGARPPWGWRPRSVVTPCVVTPWGS